MSRVAAIPKRGAGAVCAAARGTLGPMSVDDQKRAAAIRAFAHVESGQRLGLGTGSTAKHFVAELGRRLAAGQLRDIVGVPTSDRTRAQAEALGIPLLPWTDEVALDVAVDGADEVDPQLDLIKGLGGALLREKAVERRAALFVVIADDSKRVGRLGEHAPVPIEVTSVEAAVRDFAEWGPRPRMMDGAVAMSDNGHPLVDLHVGAMADPGVVAAVLEAHGAVLEHGLFLGMARVAYLATASGVDVIQR